MVIGIIQSLQKPEIFNYVILLQTLSLVQAPPPEKFVGKSLGELDVRKKYQVQVVAIRRNVEDIDTDGVKRTRQILISVPMADTVIKKTDVLLIIGSDEIIHDLLE